VGIKDVVLRAGDSARPRETDVVVEESGAIFGLDLVIDE
jgi:hypothetical protein